MNTPPRNIALLAALFASGLCLAQVPAEKPAPTVAPKIDFSTLDQDADGKLSKDEAQKIATLGGVFDTLDANDDDSLSPAEFSHWSLAGKLVPLPVDPTTAPSGSAGAQHMPRPN